jgi:putative ABC transport system permease protein
MRAPFWLKLAWRESRSSGRRLGVYMGAITLGVAALVAINSFRAQVVESVDAESKSLLGAELRLRSNRVFPDTIEAVLDSAAAAGVPVSRVVTTLSQAFAETGVPQLTQVRAIDGGYPYYGEMVTEPGGMWQQLQSRPGSALLEASLLEQLDVAVGDSVRLGATWFEIAGALTALPPEFSFRSSIGPRIYIGAADLEATQLLQFGSLATHEAYLHIPRDAELARFVDRNRETFRTAQVGIDTAADQAENLGQALEVLGRFLGLVGLSALLLGGLGVASAVNVFVKDKRRTVAVLRCLGATQRTAFGAYMLQATALGVLGAALGALLGIGLQAVLPGMVGDLLPIDVAFAVQWPVVFLGIAIGAVVAAVFSLLPLLAVRGISPLRALRHDVDDAPRRLDPWRALALLLVLGSVVAIAIWQARYWRVGLGYAAALVVGLGVLWVAARLLVALTRRLARSGFALARAGHGGSGRRRVFAARQGIANLYRPRNQTTAVTMALGFGVFLVATLWVVQTNLLGWLRTDAAGPQPNLVLFDIQGDQVDDVRALLAQRADAPPDLVPIVPARIAAINGEAASALLAEGRTPRIEPWALRREYRHTYRGYMTGAETLVEGEWFAAAGNGAGAVPASDAAAGTGAAVGASAAANTGAAPATGQAAGASAASGPPAPTTSAGPATGAAAHADTAPPPVRVSAERDVARSLGVGIGDRITWDFGGVPVESVITSIRTVEWARFETNFFFVFEPGTLEQAPQSIVSLVTISDDALRTATQRDIARQFANISIVDLASVQRLVRRIIDRVTFAIRFMAAFSVGAGALVLFGAIAASRFQRVRESALLRALGATRRQVRDILLVEYAALGALAAFTGVTLAAIAGWLVMRFAFRMEFVLPFGALAVIWVLVTAAAAGLGMLNSREALRSTPLAALREAER